MRNLSGSLYVILLAARLYFFFACCLSAGLLVTMLKSKPSKSGAKELTHTLPEVTAVVIPEVRRRGKQTVWISTIALLVGIGLGYEGRKIQKSSKPSSLPETLILDVNSDGSYYMLAADGRTLNTAFCPDKNGNVDHSLVRGNKLREFKFKQRANCKEIYGDGLGYVAYFDHGVRSVFPIPMEVADAR